MSVVLNGIKQLAPGDPAAYWDRIKKVPRSFRNEEEMPDYRGNIIMYMDGIGIVLALTWATNGKRGFIPIAKL